jgi:hypothetical protein
MQEDEQFEEVRLGYQLTRLQQDAFDALVRAVDDMTDRMEEARSVESQERPGSQEKDLALKRINKLCLELCITLLNHKLGNNKYKSVIISGLAVLGFWNNRG